MRASNQCRIQYTPGGSLSILSPRWTWEPAPAQGQVPSRRGGDIVPLVLGKADRCRQRQGGYSHPAPNGCLNSRQPRAGEGHPPSYSRSVQRGNSLLTIGASFRKKDQGKYVVACCFRGIADPDKRFPQQRNPPARLKLPSLPLPRKHEENRCSDCVASGVTSRMNRK